MELVTMHTHTNYTGHGHGTVAELVDAAEAAKEKFSGLLLACLAHLDEA